MGLQQRGLIYTEHKPLGRLYKMCKLFYHVFRVIPSANGFQLFGLQSLVSTIYMQPTRKAVNREGKRSRRYRDRHFAKFERSCRYRDR
jgi:hypothetical protein